MPALLKPATGTLKGRRFTASAAASAAPGAPAGAPPAPTAAAGAVATADRVNQIIRATFAGKFSSDAILRLGDGHFYLPTVAEATQVLVDSSLDRRVWTAERFDCDDFSYVLKGEYSVHSYDTGDIAFGFAAGIIWGKFSWVDGYHAVNLFVASDGILRLIEPQSDKIYAATECLGEIGLLVV